MHKTHVGASLLAKGPALPKQHSDHNDNTPLYNP